MNNSETICVSCAESIIIQYQDKNEKVLKCLICNEFIHSEVKKCSHFNLYLQGNTKYNIDDVTTIEKTFCYVKAGVLT